ncbi:pyruvate dehydrogenase (acetyl-transferring) E1 component subunit alpha [Candidatus Woesearchaeota archaeon CG10_big_fil_rev_8_21_14_0_10_37_12]|nr:MAG: pyruvate dehydrogenase (acetyl-transferring) E1 component subunit alpha [Candidatus Woesearchaeota archaeon CG10_big_fil_rev_8_21_14_0_10_37_12]
MKKTVAKFEIQYVQILNEKGEVDKKLEPKLSVKQLKEIYKWMVLERTFDNTALMLQREGRIGTFAQSLGEEATHVGATFATEKVDWVFPDYREHIAFMMKGVAIKDLLTHWGGSEDGMKLPKNTNMFSVCIPVGTQTLHGVGAAIAAKLQKKKFASLTFVGDASTSTGDFHEGLNFAGVFQAPAVVVIRNNQWAISVPRTCQHADWGGCQTRAETLAQKGIGYNINSVQVDGNDVLAVYSVVKQAIDNAKKGKGPTLVECVTYRLGPHTTADDPTRYVDSKTLKQWEKKEPLTRFKLYLKKKKIWTEQFEKQVRKEAKQLVDKGVAEFEKHKPKPTDMFDYVYEKLTPNLKAQRLEWE